MAPDTYEDVDAPGVLDPPETATTDDDFDFSAGAGRLPSGIGLLALVSGVVVLGLVAVTLAVVRARSGGDGDLRIDAAPGAPVTGGRLLYGLAGDPEGFEPGRVRWDESGLQVANALYDPVTAFDAEGRPQPYLVESLEPSGDLTQWTFRLRQGVWLSNGEPLDGGAFAEFLQLSRRSGSPGSVSQLISDVRVLDELTVRLTAARPWATLPVHLAGQGGFVVSPRSVDVEAGVSVPAGSGPFLLRRWDRGRRLVLARNSRYWRKGLPRLDAVELVVVPDGTARLEQVQRGELDVAPLTTAEEQRAVDETNARREPGRQLVVERDPGAASATALLLSTDRPPLDDVRVRRALAHALDLRALAAAQGWPAERLAQGPLAPGSPFHRAAAWPGFDLDRARDLVREYVADPGGGRGRAITFTVHATSADTRLLNQLVDQWSRAGIKAGLAIDTRSELRRRGAQGELDAVLLPAVGAVDPDQLWPYLVPEQAPPPGTFTFSRTGDRAVTEAMTDGRSTLDPAARREAYGRMQRALAEQVPYLWLVRTEPRLVVSARVREARNGTLPGGAPALPFVGGAHRLTETWIAP